MSENEIVPTSLQQLVIPNQSSEFAEPALIEDIVTEKFLPYIALNVGTSKAYMDEKAEINTWTICKSQKHLPLGKRFDCWPIKWTPKATDRSDAKAPTIAVYNPKHPEFMRIKKASDDNPGKMLGYMYGFEFLIWVPKYKLFGSYFAASPTSRRAMLPLTSKDVIGKPATLNGKWYENTNNKWWGPELLACSTPFEALPTQKQTDEAVEKFLNHKEIEIGGDAERVTPESAPAAADGERVR